MRGSADILTSSAQEEVLFHKYLRISQVYTFLKQDGEATKTFERICQRKYEVS